MFILASIVGQYFREILFMIDVVVYTFVGGVYNLFIDITKVRIDNDTINSFANSIYAIIALYSLFIMSKMLINIIINPEGFSDKKKGVSSIFARLVIAIFLIVLLPFIFEGAYWLQDKAINADSKSPGIILELLLGEKQQLMGDVDPGEEIKNLVVQALIKPEDEYAKYDQKIETTIDGVKKTFIYYRPIGACAENDDCKMIVEGYNFYLASIAKGTKSSIILLSPIISNRAKLENPVTNEKSKEFVITYPYIIVTICGALIIYVLLSFCIDVAVRIFKLGVLEILAPVFVATYVDAKSAESGPFSKWQKETISTYIQVFIRVALVALFIVFVRLMGDSSGKFFGVVENGTNDRWLVKLALVLGLLIFIKKAPKMIEDLLGIKSDSKLGILNKLGEAALIGGSAKALGEKIKKTRKGIQNSAVGGIKKGFGSAVSGYTSASRAGATGGKKSKQFFGGFAKGLRTGAVEGYSAENTKGYYTKGRKETDPQYRTLGQKASDLAQRPLQKAENKYYNQDLEKDVKTRQKRENLLMPLSLDAAGHAKAVSDDEFIWGKQIPGHGQTVTYSLKDVTTGVMGPTKVEPVLSMDDVKAVKTSAEFKTASPATQYATTKKMNEIIEATATGAITAVDAKKEIGTKLSQTMQQINAERAKTGPDLSYVADLGNKQLEFESRKSSVETEKQNAQGNMSNLGTQISAAQTALTRISDAATRKAKLLEISKLEEQRKAEESRISHFDDMIADLETKIAHTEEAIRQEKAKPVSDPHLIDQLEQTQRELENEQERNNAAIEKANKMGLKIEGEDFDPENYEQRTKVSQHFAKEKEDAEKLKPADKK